MVINNPLFQTLIALELLGWNVNYATLDASIMALHGKKSASIEMTCTFVPAESKIIIGYLVRTRYVFNECAVKLLERLQVDLAHFAIAIDWGDRDDFMIFHETVCPQVYESWSSVIFAKTLDERFGAGMRLVLSCINALKACERVTIRGNASERQMLASIYLANFCLHGEAQGVYTYN